MPDALVSPTVILTRTRERNAPLRAALASRGLGVIELTCARTDAAEDPRALARALQGLGGDDLLVLTSRAAVSAVAAVVDPSTVAAPVAAVGPSTAEEARVAGLRVAFVASRPDGAALGAELPLPAGAVVLARSDRALDDLPRALRARGAQVRELVAYRTVAGTSGDAGAVAAAIRAGGATVVLASPSAVEGLLTAIPAEHARRAAIVAIGPSTAAAVRERIGVEPFVAPDTGTEALVGSVERAILGRREEQVVA